MLSILFRYTDSNNYPFGIFKRSLNFMLILYLQLQPQQQHLQYQPIQRQVCMTKHNSENLNTSRFTDRDLHVYINGVTRGLIGG